MEIPARQPAATPSHRPDLARSTAQGDSPIFADAKGTDRPTCGRCPLVGTVPRRGLLRAMFGSLMGLGFTALGAVGGLWAALGVRFMMPNVTTELPSRLKVGLPLNYPPGYVETRYQQRYGVWIIHAVYQGQPQIYALRTACTHLGCITIWNETERKFKCPCHGSGFQSNGINLEGPAPRPLERVAIALADDGQLEIDRSRIFQEELGGWRDRASYVLP